MNAELQRLFDEADQASACFVTVTILDPTKQKENLTHHTLVKNFPLSEVAGSLDACAHALSIYKPRSHKQQRFLRGQ